MYESWNKTISIQLYSAWRSREGGRYSSADRAPESWSDIRGFKTRQERSFPELTYCAVTYTVSIPPSCYCSDTPKTLGHSAKSASGRLQLKTHTAKSGFEKSGRTNTGSLISCVFWIWSQGGLYMLSRHSVEPLRETSSRVTLWERSSTVVSFSEPLWIDPDLESGVVPHELISN